MSVADQRLDHRIVVAVPTLNEAASIENCLWSLVHGEGLADVLVVVADGGSTEETVSIVDRLAADDPRIKRIANAEGNQAHAVNLVAQQADPARDILIRCDAHAIYPDGFLLGVAQALLDREADSLVIPMDARAPADAPPFQRANAFIVDTPLGSGGSAHRGGSKSGWIDHGHHAGFLRKRFMELGGYDPAMIGNEDAEYDTRLAKAGGRIWLDPSLRIIYFPRASAKSLFRQYRRYGQARARHLIRHRKRPRLRQMIPVLHIFATAGSVAMLGISSLALVYPALYVSALLIAMIYGFATLKDRAALHIPLILATMHTSWGLGFLAEALRGKRGKP